MPTQFNGLTVPDRTVGAQIGGIGETRSGAFDRASFVGGGESVLDRNFAVNGSAIAGTGQCAWSTFEAVRSETISRVRTFSGTTAAAATPTMCKVGVYEVADNGNFTQVAVTANNTALWATAHTAYTEALLASFEKVAGRRYAVMAIVVSGVALPSFMCGGPLSVVSAGFDSGMIGELPKLAGRVGGGQTDLLASYANASLSATGFGSLHALLLP